MLFQIKSYIKFLWHSKNEHAVHSPFVFSLITKCFYDKQQKPAYSILKKYREALLSNQNTITVTDFGAGSKVFRSNTREIAQIAKTAGISPKRAKLLYRISHYFESKSILEIGTSLGLATVPLALGNAESQVTTLEGCPETAQLAMKQFKTFDLKNIHIQVGEFDVTFEKIEIENAAYDLVYFDGNHSKKATLDYFHTLLPTASNDTVWIFDDIHWSEDMEAAWSDIKRHPTVTVTIDTYQWGFVFFRKEQPKEHFIIRI
ncbi:methyltransferase [Flavobacterium faecale]|uniref:Methyltransferase n=1 Tax=Flavobacterium faecale TaxID=1355330 RepID=A0A2S1LDB7_9FLAO|nr:class I SAM-dependent methyltransferase [Flavobacterium faecale]AWG21752.1 methyltransferase [Flavobacterium faecale]